MSRETLTAKAIEMVIIELIGQGIATKEALIEAMKRQDVQDSVKMAIEILEKEFN